MTFHPKVRDSQNPYRTGVLVENFVEDGIGQELALDPRQGSTGITEKQAKHSLGSTLLAYDIPERDQAAILADKQYQDYASRFVDRSKKGTDHHLLMGHGPDQAGFEDRDMGTTNDMVYANRVTTGQMIHPMNFSKTSTRPLIKEQTNCKIDEVPMMFASSEATAQLGALKPKSYNNYTKTFDNNSRKLGLRE